MSKCSNEELIKIEVECILKQLTLINDQLTYIKIEMKKNKNYWDMSIQRSSKQFEE